MKKIFLIIIAFATIINATATDRMNIEGFQGSTLMDLSGRIEVSWEYSTLKSSHDYITGANIRYSGPENVTLTVSVDGNIIGTSSENNFFLPFYDNNGTFFLKGSHTMLVTASAAGYNDLSKSEEFTQADWSGKICYDLSEGYIYIYYNGLEYATMTISYDGEQVYSTQGTRPYYYTGGGEEITFNSKDGNHVTINANKDFLDMSTISNNLQYVDCNIIDIVVSAEGHDDLFARYEYEEPTAPAPYFWSDILSNDLIQISGGLFEGEAGIYGYLSIGCTFFTLYGSDDYCSVYAMRGNEDYTIGVSGTAWIRGSGYDPGFTEKEIVVSARDKSGNIPTSDPHSVGSWIVLKDINGADVWYKLGETIPVKKSVFGDSEVPFRFVYEGAFYGQYRLHDNEDNCDVSALFETGEDFYLTSGYNYNFGIAFKSILEEDYPCYINSNGMYVLGHIMLANITQLDSIADEPEPEFIRGDVNGDGIVDVSDVAGLVGSLLTGNPIVGNGDANQDGMVDVSDIASLVDYLLKGAWSDEPEPEPAGETFTVNGVSFKMMPVEGGTFTMGATEEEDADYQVFQGSPKHQVTLNGFSIGQTEVTQELWQAVMGNNPSNHTGNMQYPVENINWEDCQTFITELNRLTGKTFRLPTEAEWEYAAQGGNKTQGYTYSGSDDLGEVAWYLDNSGGESHPVATKAPNELGIYDMNGNIEEWCNDWYSLYTEDAVTNPTGPETGTSRIHRGGRFGGSSKFCRITRRDGFVPTVVRNYMGLRLAM